MVGRHRARRTAFELFPVDESAHFVAAPKVEDQPAGAARESPQDRRDRRGRYVRRGLGNGGRAPCQARFRLADGRDHPFIGFFRGLAEREDAVFEEDQPLDRRIAGMGGGAGPGELETRHDVGDQPHRPAIDFAANLLTVRLVGQREHCIRMGVIDEFVRQEGVQQGFDRGVGRLRFEKIAALVVDHLLVAQPVEGGEAAQRIEPDRGEARRFDTGHVPAASLDAKHVDGLVQQVAHGRLDRCVAPAVKHQSRVSSQKTRRVDPERDVRGDAVVLVTGDRRCRVRGRIEALHGGYPAAARRRSG